LQQRRPFAFFCIEKIFFAKNFFVVVTSLIIEQKKIHYNVSRKKIVDK